MCTYYAVICSECYVFSSAATELINRLTIFISSQLVTCWSILGGLWNVVN